MATSIRKTDKGRAEIQTRSHRLPPRLRHLLILVDGQRTLADLGKLVAQCDDALAELLDLGFVEADAVAAPAPVERPAPVSAPLVARNLDPVIRRREAVRRLTDAVGPHAEALALRIESAADEMTLRPLLVLARDSIRNVKGAAAADAFTEQFLSWP